MHGRSFDFSRGHQQLKFVDKMRSAQTHFCAWAIMKKLSICVMKNIT